MADTTRLRLLALLSSGPLCVCHFQAVLNEPQAKISKHLAVLRERGLVKARREGHWVVYALAEPGPAVLGVVPELAGAEAQLKRDGVKLMRLDLGCSPAAGARRVCAC